MLIVESLDRPGQFVLITKEQVGKRTIFVAEFIHLFDSGLFSPSAVCGVSTVPADDGISDHANLWKSSAK